MDPLDSATTFPYLGHTIAYNNINWEALYKTLRKAQRCWDMVLGVLVKAGVTVRDREMFYKSVM